MNKNIDNLTSAPTCSYIIHIPYSPEQAPPVIASTSAVDILAFTGGACSGDYGTTGLVHYHLAPATSLSRMLGLECFSKRNNNAAYRL